jgi:hypothetical protein
MARQGELKKAVVENGHVLAISLWADHPDTREALRNIQNLPLLMIR